MSTSRFSKSLTSVSANNIVTLLDLPQELAYYEQFKAENIVDHSIILEDLQCKVGLFSLLEADWPDTNALASESAVEAARAKIFKEGQKIYLELYIAKGNGPWELQGEEILQNKNGLEQPWALMAPWFSTNETALLGEDLKIGVRVANKAQGVGGLKGTDYLRIFGSWRKQTKIELKKKDDGIDALRDRISALETLLSVYGAPSANLPGSNGLVPAPPAGSGEFLLRGDRGWKDPSEFATPAQITAAISNLVGNSSAALDTLAELGAALANDASFATTFTNALNAKAPTQSPTLTGTPAAPTANYGLNSTQIATTAFVQAALGALSEIKTLTLTNTLNVAANTWITVGQFLGVGLPSQGTLYGITVHIQYGDGTNSYGHWQYSGGGLISSVQWKAGGVQNGSTFKMEAHNGNDFNCSVRFDLSNINRTLQILFDVPIATEAPTTLTVKLRRIIPS